MKKDTLVYPAKAYYIVVVLLVVASFMLGSLFTKVQYLQAGPTAGAGQVKSKYKTFEEAITAYAKATKLDAKKLISCMNSDEKKTIVDAGVSEGNAVGVTGTPAFLINGKLLGGAFPFESFKEVIDKELEGKGSTKVEDYSKALQDAAKSGAFDPEPKQISVGNSSVRGKSDAPVMIVEFSDFQCPFCSRVHPTVKQVIKEYGDKVALVYKHFPLNSIHPRAQKAAEAAECAKDQGKFWEFHDQLIENQTDWASL